MVIVHPQLGSQSGWPKACTYSFSLYLVPEFLGPFCNLDSYESSPLAQTERLHRLELRVDVSLTFLHSRILGITQITQSLMGVTEGI